MDTVATLDWFADGAKMVQQFNAPPEKLYHYTDFKGLQGMLESGRLWATYCRTLNDGSEQEFGYSVVRDVLSGYAYDKKSLDGPAFVACFCERPDVLSMWQSYASLGGGYCLEMDGETLGQFRPTILSSPVPPNELVLLLRIVYGSDLPDEMRRILELVQSKLAEDNGSPKPNKMNRTFCGVLASLVASQIKHKAFKEEKEWRLLATDPSPTDMKFRPGHANVKPYVELHQSDDGASPSCQLPRYTTVRLFGLTQVLRSRLSGC